MRTVTIREENTMLARVVLHSMAQDCDETVRSFSDRLRVQASVCKFNIKCTGCDHDVNFTEEILLDVVSRGLYDHDIQLDLLEDYNQELTLEKVLEFVETKEEGKRSSSNSRLIDNQGADADSSKCFQNHSGIKPYDETRVCVENDLKIRESVEADNSKDVDNNLVLDTQNVHENSTSSIDNEFEEIDTTYFTAKHSTQRKMSTNNANTCIEAKAVIGTSDENALNDTISKKPKSNKTYCTRTLTSRRNKSTRKSKKKPDSKSLSTSKMCNKKSKTKLCVNNTAMEQLTELSDSNTAKEKITKFPPGIKEDNESSYACEICGKSFDKPPSLLAHLKVHEDRKHQCNLCGRRFRYEKYYKKHLIIHTEDNPYCCQFCSKHFKSSDSLKTHLRIHNPQKPYQCDVCGKNFNQPTNLINHKKVHVPDKAFICDICEQEFTKNSALIYHMSMHGVEGLPHKCRTCGKVFGRKSHLDSHMSIHTSARTHICEICQQGFTSKMYLYSHLKSHSNKKAYICDVCGKGFNHGSSLKYHIRTHTGAKPYLCDVCKKSFRTSCSLNNHKKSHTGK